MKVSERWDRFWFSDGDPRDLAACRCLFYPILFYLWFVRWDSFRIREVVALGDADPAFWFPVSIFKALDGPLLSSAGMQWLVWAWALCLALAAVGAVTRLSTWAAFLLGIYIIGLPHNFGKLTHCDSVIVILLGVLAVSRCGDAWSLDRWLANRKGRAQAPPSPEYTWPIQFACVLMLSVFFLAGVAKLQTSGLDWALSDNLSNLLYFFNSREQQCLPSYSWFPELARWIAGQGWLAKTFAMFALALELFAPLALLLGRWRVLYALSLFALNLSITLLMGPDFMLFTLGYLFFVPWRPLIERFRRSPTSRVNSAASSK